MKTMKDLLAQLKDEAAEEINFGNSKEISYGKGIMEAINRIKEYCKNNKIKLDL
jgi:hypothetical protein